MRFDDLQELVRLVAACPRRARRVVMETLGHSNISITMATYTHVLPELQRLAADASIRRLATDGEVTEPGRYASRSVTGSMNGAKFASDTAMTKAMVPVPGGCRSQS